MSAAVVSSSSSSSIKLMQLSFVRDGVISSRLPSAPMHPPDPVGSSMRIKMMRKKGMRWVVNVSEEVGGGVVVSRDAVEQDARFVRRFREAWPYFRAHRGSTFGVVISGDIVSSNLFDQVLKARSALRGGSCLWGRRRFYKTLRCSTGWVSGLLLCRGHRCRSINFWLREVGEVCSSNYVFGRRQAKYFGCYRITDPESLEAAMEAAGRTSLMIEAKLSPGPPICSIRRHGDSSRLHDVGVSVASGNFLAAKRRGVVEGVDYGATGEVKKVDVSRIRERLDGGCIVILSNLGYSSSGEVLNCNTYEVATACAMAIGAEKLICVLDGPILDESGHLIRFLTLHEADMLIRKLAKQSETAANYVEAIGKDDIIDADVGSSGINGADVSVHKWKGTTTLRDGWDIVERRNATFRNGVGFDNGNGLWEGEQGFAIGGLELQSRMNGYISELAAAAFVCRGGVPRVHLLDGTIGGALLLELFQRDGIGTMVASDLYEGTRTANDTDLSGIRQLLKPLEESGTLIRRTDEELLEALKSFIVVEREGHIIACAALFPFYEEKHGEVAAIAVSPECRGQGQGDKLLDYIEKTASSLGLEILFLLTTRTADWFVRRGFSECSIELIPERRRKKINLSRNSKYYAKKLVPKMAIPSELLSI